MAVDGSDRRLFMLVWMCYGIQLTSGNRVYTHVAKNTRLEFSTQSALPSDIYDITMGPSGSGFLLMFGTNSTQNPQIISNDRNNTLEYLQSRIGVSLTINNTQLTDAGHYMLKKYTNPSLVLANLTLIVLNKPDILPIQPVSTDPPTVDVRYIIRCIALSTSQPVGHGLSMVYSWKERGSHLNSESARYNLSNDQLQIESIRKGDDRFRFTCQASETGGSITVISADNSPYAIQKPHYLQTVKLDPSEYYSIVKGRSNIFKCTSDAYPAASYSWKKDNSTINGETDSTYSFQATDVNQSGVYTCEASNRVGTITASVTVDIQYGAGSSDNVTFYPPEVAYEFIEGNSAGSSGLNVTCSADCNPPCIVEWDKQEDKNSQWQSWIGSGSLQIGPNIDRNDHGTYRCQVSDTIPDSTPGGNISSVYKTLTVAVNYQPKITEFEITPTEVMEGGNVTFSCKADGRPDSFIELPVYQGDGTPQKIKSEMVVSKNATCDEMMEFTCFASNIVGNVNKTAMLNVKCSPRIYNFSEFEVEQFSAVGKNTTITVPILAYPKPTVVDWIHTTDNGTRIRTVTPRTLIYVSDNKFYSVLDLSEVRESDFGNYTISIENAVGKYNITLILSAAGCPMPPKSLTVIEAKHSAVVLQWISGYPNGDEQNFTVYYTLAEDNSWNLWGTVADSADKTNSANIQNLKGSTQYRFKVIAKNKYNDVDKDCEPKSETIGTTQAVPDDGSSIPVAAIAGGVAGGVLAFILVIVLIIFIRRRRLSEGDKKDKALMPNGNKKSCNNRDDSEKTDPKVAAKSFHNEMYNSSGAVALKPEDLPPNPEYISGHDIKPSTSDTISPSSDVEYAVVDKSKDEKTDGKKENDLDLPPNPEYISGHDIKPSTSDTISPSSDVEYAVVDKSKDEKTDGKKENDLELPPRNPIYQSADKVGATKTDNVDAEPCETGAVFADVDESANKGEADGKQPTQPEVIYAHADKPKREKENKKAVAEDPIETEDFNVSVNTEDQEKGEDNVEKLYESAAKDAAKDAAKSDDNAEKMRDADRIIYADLDFSVQCKNKPKPPLKKKPKFLK